MEEVMLKKIEELIETPNPEWVKVDDIELLSQRIEAELENAKVLVFQNAKYIGQYKNQYWDIVTGNGHFTVEQGRYDYLYLPMLGQNLAQRIPELPIIHSFYLSRETVKSYLYRKGEPQEKMDDFFVSWLGNSSTKWCYWKHWDCVVNGTRWMTVGNHAGKNMLVIQKKDGYHIFCGKEHIVVPRLSNNFISFIKNTLENGKNYSVSGTGWSLTW